MTGQKETFEPGDEMMVSLFGKLYPMRLVRWEDNGVYFINVLEDRLVFVPFATGFYMAEYNEQLRAETLLRMTEVHLERFEKDFKNGEEA